MANYFLDTSALAKRYHVEKGTPEVERILNEPGSAHYISRLAVEISGTGGKYSGTQNVHWSHDRCTRCGAESRYDEEDSCVKEDSYTPGAKAPLCDRKY